MGDSADIQYSEKYSDKKYEYRHVILPATLAKLVPKAHLMTETEWRNLGIQQSPGWVHYIINTSEPHVVCFRKPIVVVLPRGRPPADGLGFAHLNRR